MNARSWLRGVGRVSLFVVLLLGPALARAAYYYRRPYVPLDVPRPDLARVQVSGASPVPFSDVDVRPGNGVVVIDRGHGNRVDDAELNVLLARLTDRDMQATLVRPGDSLSGVLRTAAALVIVSPHAPYSDDEIADVKRFVEQGGRVLLAADPSRYTVEAQFDEVSGEQYIAQSDVPAINSLASAFGLAFADDYLYNTKENAGNYQYVILRDLPGGPLTEGVSEIAFYAARSISASEETVVRASPETASSLREQGGALATMALGGSGQVLAIGDFTFMTEPYNGSLDNNRLIANIADFIAATRRTFGLTEFPHFLGSDVDLIPVFSGGEESAFSGMAVSEVAELQSALSSAGKRLHWRSEELGSHDLIYLGLYNGLEGTSKVADILAQQGITLTLETAERARLALTPDPTRQAAQADATPTPTATLSPPRDWIHLPGIGQVDAKENALFYQNEEAGRQVLIVLAFGEDGLRAATDRLLSGGFAGCLIDDDREADPVEASVALCPAEYAAPGEVTPTPTRPADEMEEPLPGGEVSILIVADDDGEGIYELWNSAYHLYDVVTAAGYDPQAWSTTYDGPVTAGQLEVTDVVLWCTGDYQDEGGNPSPDELSMLEDYVQDGGSLLLIGAFVGDPEGRARGLLLDIELSDPGHPLAQGFEEGQIIELVRFGADEDYAPFTLLGLNGESAAWVRGPTSELSGEAAGAALEYEPPGGRLALVGMPLYLLPYDEGVQLGNNVLLWLLGEG